MDGEKRAALEAAGFRFGDAEDFLGLSPEERELVDLRVRIGRAIRQLRARRTLTQQQMAERLKTSQSRLAKIEAAEPGVSLDLMFRAFFAAGGKLSRLTRPTGEAMPPAQARRPRATAKRVRTPKVPAVKVPEPARKRLTGRKKTSTPDVI